jgi:hypothetical protein
MVCIFSDELTYTRASSWVLHRIDNITARISALAVFFLRQNKADGEIHLRLLLV